MLFSPVGVGRVYTVFLTVPLTKEQERNNRVLNRLRSVVGRVIAQIKTWRILHVGFRQPLGSYGRVFSVVRGLVFLAAGHPL